MLRGPEVKSLRAGHANLADAYAVVRGGEVFLFHLHISPYPQAGRENPDPRRERRLLLHRREIARLGGRSSASAASRWCRSRSTGRRAAARSSSALARGRKRGDKREAIREREEQREVQRVAAPWAPRARGREARAARRAGGAGRRPAPAAPRPRRPTSTTASTTTPSAAASPSSSSRTISPFMATRVQLGSAPARAARAWPAAWAPGPAPAEALLFCRWERATSPLAVHVEAPEIPPELSLDLPGASRRTTSAAVERALDLWEQGLEGLVRFERAPSAREAALALRLSADARRRRRRRRAGARHDALSAAPAASRAATPPAGASTCASRCAPSRCSVADEFGLLLPDQVERIALHEIGHALGMRTHSPIPADLMYPVVRDRLPRGELGTEDVNSFVSLYSLPNGTVYRVLDAAPDAPRGAAARRAARGRAGAPRRSAPRLRDPASAGAGRSSTRASAWWPSTASPGTTRPRSR